MTWLWFYLKLGMLFAFLGVESAVRPPPWADPNINPCAVQPRGWQLIFWPPDRQCYKIFQIGYPCPETMELVPGKNNRNGIKAECRCPPGTALDSSTEQCYELFKKGPCPKGQYFAPNKQTNDEGPKIRTGTCINLKACPEVGHIFWPLEEKCYQKYTQGPCPKGQLLSVDTDGLSICTCSNNAEMSKYYWGPLKSCYEHYTRGPCQEKGHLFLPGRVCDCHSKLTHYHEDSQQCYELESQGPCQRGHHFILNTESNYTTATCKCKPNHIIWLENGNCYRPYTQGPCPSGQIIINSTTCSPIPCSRGFLYFPEQRTCYRIGSQGPCLTGQIVTFDFKIRPSVDGVSYNGVCGCVGPFNENNSCLKEKRSAKNCEPGQIVFKNKCHRLYSQGPCADGQWLVPNRQAKWQESSGKSLGKCDCKPGYTIMLNNDKNMKCLPPSVGIANYLNKYFVKEI